VMNSFLQMNDRLIDDHETTQSELLEERSFSKCGLPPALKFLNAKSYLYARDRVRGSLPLPDFARISHVSKNNSSQDEKDLALCKATLLAIEAALPLGSVDTRENGRWRSDHATQWRMLVVESKGPTNVMQCLVQLESAIADDWFKESHNQVRLALPMGWKAIAEATYSSVIMRAMVIDRSLLYSNVDKKRFAPRKKR
jgi:hypothetical protein